MKKPMNSGKFNLFPTTTIALLIAALILLSAPPAFAQPDLDVNTPSISVIKKSLSQRFAALKPHLDTGAVGLTTDGLIATHDMSLALGTTLTVAMRAAVEKLVADENQDRASLYREIARANGHPDWESDLKTTFGERFINRAQSGWYYRDSAGKWNRKP